MKAARAWVRLVGALVPGAERRDWIEQWDGELTASGGAMTHAWGALSDAWYLRTEGWTMEGLFRDVRTAVRGLVRKPLFTMVAGLTLAVGIGANAAIFSVVDGVMLNPLPFPEADRLVSYNHEAPGIGVNVPLIPHSHAMYLNYFENVRTLESFAVMSNGSVTMVGEGDPLQLTAAFVTEGYFDVLGIYPILGRGFTAGEDRVGADPVVVLGYGLWEQSFGADPAVLGTIARLDGVPRRVIGVMPQGFAVVDEDVWLPLAIDESADADGSLGLIGVGRLADGETVESADAEMHDLLMRFAESNPETLPQGLMNEAGLDSDVKPLKEVLLEDLRPVLWVLLGTVGIVLLVACANVANLFLVRAEARQREQALRRALGASRLDVIRQYLTESVTLAVGAGLVGLAFAALGVQGLLALAPADLPRAIAIGIDGSVLAFTAAISIGSGLLFGVIPAVGQVGVNLSGALKDGGRASTGGHQRMRARSGLVVVQVALALVLLIGSGLMLRSFVALRGVDLGFDPDGMLTFSIGLPTGDYDEPREVLDFHRQLVDRLSALPGVEAAGMINGLPLGGTKAAGPMEPTDRPFSEGVLGPMVERRSVTPGYFTAMSIRLVEGRSLGWEDQADENRAIVISETLARTFWPGESALGRQIRSQGADDSWEVVGIVADVRFDGAQADLLPLAYLPALSGATADPSAANAMDVVVRVVGDPLEAVQGARQALVAGDPRVPMIRPRTVESVVDDSMASTSFTVILLGIAAGVALLLGTVGIYGVVAYVVSRRTQEIGVRMALGAPASTVVRSFLRQGLVLTAIGVGVGLLGSWAMSRALASLLYGVGATDPLTFAGTAGLVALVSTLATWIPARRASRIDPVEALRSE